MSTLRLLLTGVKSYLPSGTEYTMSTRRVDPAYGYAVWLRHCASLAKHGIRGPFPSVVELGPGNSMATGVSAILSGSSRYTGLDVLQHMAHDKNLSVLDEVAELFRSRQPIPGDAVYPNLRPLLANYEFPAEALGSQGLAATTDADRLAALRRDIEVIGRGGIGGEALRYYCPWTADSVAPESADLVITQAVLQEIPHGARRSPLRETIMAIARWLRPGGIGTHQVDMGLYGLEPWNAHWTWSDVTWTLVRGRRSNFVNREPLSTYLHLMRECGLSVVAVDALEETGVPEERLAPRFKVLDETDRRTRSALVILRKQG